MATYLETVNAVLARLREDSVASVATNTYSSLIGKFVNDAKRQVEDAWTWEALSRTVSVTTTPASSALTVTGIGLRPRDVTVNNISGQYTLTNMPLQWIIDQQDLSNVQNGQPSYYAWNGNNGTDAIVVLYPTPDAAQTIRFHAYAPQAVLTADATAILVPADVVEMGAYARALVERGEDGGLNSSEAYNLFKSMLADYIAQEAARFIENDCWEPT